MREQSAVRCNHLRGWEEDGQEKRGAGRRGLKGVPGSGKAPGKRPALGPRVRALEGAKCMPLPLAE